jgi:hypothetical protein
MQIDRAEIVAVEIDWVCYHTLQKTVGNANRVRLENRDSREYNPPGQFHAIATSFADHHIHPKDKKRYFDNVKNNLLGGSVFVVGDEFLREHDEGNEEERRKALNAWHGHIIEIAERNGEHELARLEREALRSGLEGKGDFKVSCSRYESELEESGLKVIHKEKIGPLDREDIGGIFVYVIGKK